MDCLNGNCYLNTSEDFDNKSDYSECSVDYEDDSECFYKYEGDDDYEDFTDMNDNASDLNAFEEFTISGKRIADLNHIFSEIRKIDMHSEQCKFFDMRLAKQEYKVGFVSVFQFVCRKCGYTHILKTSENRKDQFDCNYESVLGAMLIGIGYSQLEEFSGVLDLPCMSKNKYLALCKKIQVDVTGAADASCKLAAEEEKQYAIKESVQIKNVELRRR